LVLPMALIGRESNADLSLPDPQISRRHAYIQMIDGQLFGVDLRSRTGTHWEGEHKGVGWIEHHEAVQVGPFALRFEWDGPQRPDSAGPAANPLLAATCGDNLEPEVTLDCVSGPTQPFIWRMRTVLALLGRRAGGLGLALPDPSISSFHCSLLRTPLGTWVIDLLGQGGTILNGRRIRWGRLDDGDELQIGRYLIRVLLNAPTARMTDIDPPGETGTKSKARAEANGNSFEVKHEPTKAMTANPGPALETPAGAAPSSYAGGPLVALGTAPPRTELTEGILVSLFNQFATMQNQMFDQFQQAI